MRSMTWWTVGTGAVLALMGGCMTSALADTGAAPFSPKVKRAIENVLSCANPGNFDAAEAELTRNGWKRDGDVLQLATPLTVFGLSTTKIGIARDGGEQFYRAYLPGVSLPQVVKAASLKLGKDKQGYGRVTKLGVLTAEVENGETVLLCTVDTE